MTAQDGHGKLLGMRPFRVAALALVVALILPSLALARPYFDTIFKDPKHPKISVAALFTSRAKFDGAVTNVALVYHKASESNTIIPKKLRDLGVQPISWTLIEAGAGGNSENAFVSGGLSLDLAPALIGPLAKLLARAGGRAEKFSKLIVSPNGTGVKLGMAWKTDFLKDGTFQRLNDLRFPPRYSLGYTFQF